MAAELLLNKDVLEIAERRIDKAERRAARAGLVIGGLILGTIVFFVGRKVIRDVSAKAEAARGFYPANPASFAKRIRMAFANDNWPGTDEVRLRDALREIPSRQFFAEVIRSYQRMYQRSLVNDLERELTSTEYQEMLQIIAGKPRTNKEAQTRPAGSYTTLQLEAWARRLHAAFNYNHWGFLPWGTDEEAIYAVAREVPSMKAWQEVAAAYKRIYGLKLLDEMKRELTKSEQKRLAQIAWSKT